MKIRSRKVTFSIPGLIYDFAQWVMFPANYFISVLCWLQPGGSIWNESAAQCGSVEDTGKSLDKLRVEILVGLNVAHDQRDLLSLFDSLPSVQAEKDLVGRAWKGKILRTNRSVLDLAEWLIIKPASYLGLSWGKRFKTRHKGDPLFFCWLDRIYVPVPVWGNVAVTDVRWRGECTATMTYDQQAWRDYFKVLLRSNGDLVLLGVCTHKHTVAGWFTLTLDESVPV
ncbi:DUF4334 domain-containing protein [Alcanivorax sp. 1008]|uniref:DUF4334 domain-containing protein n=1 Tax=Alcanivorax sp. 1008 TaxID=2816853 RepID=UPI001D3878A5|nr:DUF4334 domain-containing protein [Alcanivorax sp. 1008]MCC1498152.1 hypothetical protein [Alcanivorax sp. 1008]